MLTLQNLAAQVQKHINMGIVEFQKFLSIEQIYDHKEIIKVLSDIMASDLFNHEHKQLAAASLKFLLSKRLNQNYNLYLTPCWEEYFMYFISRQPGDQIQWKYLSLTISAVKYLVQELSQQIAARSIEKFHATNLVGKVMLMYAFKDNQEVSSKNLYLFFNQTIDAFLHQVWEFLKHIHCQQVNDTRQSQQIHINTILFEHDVIMAIDQWLEFVSESPGEGWKIKLDQLAMNENIVYIIKEEMRLSLVEDNESKKWCYKVSDELITFNEDIIAKMVENNNNSNNRKQSQKILQKIMNIKSYTLNILKNLIKAFSCMAGLQQFDTIHVLSMLELITPILIEFLDKSMIIKQHYLKSKNNQMMVQVNDLLTSSFGVLNTSATFIFLMQTLQQLKSPILYSIITPYLQSPYNEIQQFTNDSQDFISTSENFIQKVPTDKCSTPKQACGNFMQSYFKLINSVQIQFMEFLALSLQYNVHNKEKSPLLKQIESQGYQIPSIQTIYAILARIYFFADKLNSYFLNFVYENFINQQFVFQFKKVEKVRFLIFIQYAYGQYFQKDIDSGGKFINFAFDTKDKSDVEFQMFLYLLQDTFSFGIAENTWEYIISEVQKTKKRKFLSLIHRLLQNHIHKIPHEKILLLAQRIKNRIKKYVIENKATLKQSGTYFDFLYKCFQIISTLSENKKLMSEEPSIMDETLEIIDFFNENQLESYEFSCEIIKIFNSIIQFQDMIPIEFQKYLCMMSKIVEKNKLYGPLLETYYLILLKASETFEQHPQFLEAIKSSIEDKILSQANRTQEIVIESIFLLQNIYLVYPHLIKENRNLFDATFKIYQLEKQNLNPNPKIVASILLFWMAGEYAFGNYNLGILNDCKIQIFTEQFGLMFALNLRKLIEKYFQTQSLSYLLKLSLKLLDYEHFYKNNKNYKGPVFTLPIFKKYLMLDSFEEINSAIQFLRENLSKEKFFQSIEILKNQIGEKMVNDLLKKRIFNNRKERNIIKVKRN